MINNCQSIYNECVNILPLDIETNKGILTIKSIEVSGKTLILSGYGVLSDPDTQDNSWTWHIGNPPILVEDPDGDLFKTYDSLDTEESVTIYYSQDPIAALIDIVKRTVEV